MLKVEIDPNNIDEKKERKQRQNALCQLVGEPHDLS
jgi:hypothetical protein